MKIFRTIFIFLVSHSVVFLSLAQAGVIQGEIGPLPREDQEVMIDVKDAPQAFRTQSYGGTTLVLQVNAIGLTLPKYFVEGPLPENGDTIPVGGGRKLFVEHNLSNKADLDRVI